MAVVVATENKPSQVDTFINQAIASNAPIETMERLFALHREAKADQAREAFVRAMADFQKDCPIIKKNKKVLNKDGRTVRYTFATLDSIVSQVGDILARNGLTYTFTDNVEQTSVEATCKVTHVFGHSETSSFRVPIDAEGYMTAPQKVASALTFAKRYAFKNALGILTGEEDVDATDVKKDKSPTDIKAQIVFLLRQLGVTANSKEETAQKILELTHLEATNENYEEIKSRLTVLLDERNADDSKA